MRRKSHKLRTTDSIKAQSNTAISSIETTDPALPLRRRKHKSGVLENLFERLTPSYRKQFSREMMSVFGRYAEDSTDSQSAESDHESETTHQASACRSASVLKRRREEDSSDDEAGVPGAKSSSALTDQSTRLSITSKPKSKRRKGSGNSSACSMNEEHMMSGGLDAADKAHQNGISAEFNLLNGGLAKSLVKHVPCSDTSSASSAKSSSRAASGRSRSDCSETFSMPGLPASATNRINSNRGRKQRDTFVPVALDLCHSPGNVANPI